MSSDDEYLDRVDEGELKELKSILGDAYTCVDGKDLVGNISWGSDADDATQTGAPSSHATSMHRAESEDSRAVKELRKEVTQLQNLLNEDEETRISGLDSDLGAGLTCADDPLGPVDVERYTEDAVKEATALEANAHTKRTRSRAPAGQTANKVPNSQLGESKKNTRQLRPVKSNGQKLKGVGGKRKKRNTKNKSNVDLVNDDKAIEEQKTKGSLSASEKVDFQSIRSSDFQGLLSEKCISHSLKDSRSSVKDHSIHDSDFNEIYAALSRGGSLEDVVVTHEYGPPADAHEEFGLEDILNGNLPKDWDNRNISKCIKLVIDRNQSLQRELEATIDSIDTAVENNLKALQLARALYSMRLSVLKWARPSSSCVMDEEQPIEVRGRIQTSYWSTPDGKHPLPTSESLRFQSLIQYVHLQHQFFSSWTFSEQTRLCTGLVSYVQELALLSSVETLENQRRKGERITMATARSIVTELNGLKLSSPIALEIISKFRKPEWDEISKMFVHSRSGYECMLQWNYFTRPDRVVSKFSQAEMTRIGIMSAELSGRNWKKIAEELGTGRSPAECFKMHIQTLALPTKAWSAEEDARLLEAIKVHGHGNWVRVSTEVGRTSGACESRYVDVLVPRLEHPEMEGKRRSWDMEEELQLLKAVRKHGRRWRDVTLEMGSLRKPSGLRERYAKYLDPTYDRSPFTENDKQILLKAVRGEKMKLGQIRWTEVARSMPTKRLPSMISQLYLHMMKCIEAGKNPFKTEMVVKSFEFSRARLNVNVDGTCARDSTDEDVEDLDCGNSSKRARVTETYASAGDITTFQDAQISQSSMDTESEDSGSCIIFRAPKLSDVLP